MALFFCIAPKKSLDFYWYFRFVVELCNFSVDDGGKWKFPEKQITMGVINLAYFCLLSILILLHSFYNQKKEICTCKEIVQSKKKV